MSGAGGGKRPSGGDSPPGPPEKKLKKEEKTTTTLIEPIRIGGVSSTEEMDMKVIQFKNKKLCERLEQRQALEDELREKIEKLEKRQATDDTTLLIVNRCWTQLEENIHELLQHVEPKDAPAPVQIRATPPVPADAPVPAVAPSPAPEPSAPLPAPVEGEDGLPQPSVAAEGTEDQQQPSQEKEQQQEQQQQPDSVEKSAEAPVADEIPAPSPLPPLSESAKAFLAILDNSSEEELTLQLQDRMQFSKGAVACMVCIFDRLHTSIDKLCTRVESAGCEDDSQRDIATTNRKLLEENNRLFFFAFLNLLSTPHEKKRGKTVSASKYHNFTEHD
nr:Si:rp71-1c10.1 protein [Danio rerio]